MLKTAVPVLLLLWAVFIAEASWFRHTKSLTFDETIYLNLSLQSIHDGWLDSRFVESGIAPLPMMITYIPTVPRGAAQMRPEPWQGHIQHPQWIVAPRLANSLLIGLPLITVLFGWLYRRRGLSAAILGAGMLTFSPTIAAHGALATTDLTFALFGMLGIAATGWYFSSPTLWRLTVWAAAIGAAVSAKYSGVFLLPTAGLMLVLEAFLHRNQSGRRFRLAMAGQIAVRYAILLLFAFLFCWMFHLFASTGPLKAVSVEETADYSPWFKILGRGRLAEGIMTFAHQYLPRPAPIEGIFFQLRHGQKGHPAYLMGQHSQFGWWQFFPLAYLFKSTLPELLLTLTIVGLLVRRCWHPWRSLAALDVGLRSVLLSSLVYMFLLMTAKINIGHRFLILLYPIVALVGADCLARLLENRKAAFAAVAGLLLTGQALSMWGISPHYLAYFNFLVGGPENGRQLLVDSSLDWGQDLPSLNEFQGDHPDPLALKYFGTAIPEAYGVRAANVDELPTDLNRFRYLAISATYLQGAYSKGVDPFAAFRDFRPSANAGHSILIFDLQSPDRRAAFEEALRKLPATFDESTEIRWHSAPP